MRYELAKGTHGCVVMRVLDADNNLQTEEAFRPSTTPRRNKLASQYGFDLQKLIDDINAVMAESEASDEPEAPEPLTIFMRGLRETEDRAIKFQDDEPLVAIRKALGHGTYGSNAEPVLKWKGVDRLAVLDIDYHNTHAPPLQDAMRLVERCEPKPYLWWQSHGGGLHLVYTEVAHLTADEAAAVAALSVVYADPSASVEIKSESRHPLYHRRGRHCSDVMEDFPGNDLGGLRSWFAAEAVSVDVQSWLDERGLEPGRGYPHDKCPIDPGRSSHSDSPVFVGDHGIYCSSCEARGVAHPRCAVPGQAPYSRIIANASRPNKIKQAALRFCHWEHAKHTIENEFHVNRDISKRAYKAALKTLHEPDDPRIDRVFRECWYVRGKGGLWLHCDTFQPVSRQLGVRLLKTLPFAINAWKDGEDWQTMENENRLETLQQVGNIIGYDEILPVRGMRIWGQFKAYPDHRLRIVPPNTTQMAYRGRDRRLPLEQAWRIVERSFPAIDRDYVMLLIAARGFAESGIGMLPMLMAIGPSGAAKTNTVRVAAEMIGDTFRSIDAGEKDLNMLLGDTSAAAGFVAVDEFAKAAFERHPHDPRRGMTTFLQLDRNYTYRKLYVGPITITIDSAFVLTDTEIPPSIQRDRQIGRRMILVELPTKVPDWQDYCKEGIDGWRDRDPEHREAAEAIISHVVDEYFAPGGSMNFFDVATDLGFGRLFDSSKPPEGVDTDALIRELFDAVCDENAPRAGSRFTGRGWKRVDLGGNNRISKAWAAVADSDNLETSRIVSEADLGDVLGATCPVKCKWTKRPNTSYLGIRFTNHLAPQNPDFLVNEEIIAGKQPEDSPDGGGSGSAPDGALDEAAALVGRLFSNAGGHESGPARDAGGPVAGVRDEPVATAGAGRVHDRGQHEPESAGTTGDSVRGDAGPDRGTAGPRDVAPDPTADAGTPPAPDAGSAGRPDDGTDRDRVPERGRVRGAQTGGAKRGRQPRVVVPLAPTGDVVTSAPVPAGMTVPTAEKQPIHFDFETRSMCDLKKAGGYKYAYHPSTEIMCAAYKDPRTGDAHVWTPLLDEPLDPADCWPQGHNPFMKCTVHTHVEFPAAIAEAIAEGHPMAAHNGYGFDEHIHRRYGLPEPEQWLDTMFTGRAAGFTGSLQTTTQYLIGTEKDEGADITIKLSKPDTQGRFLPLNRSNLKLVARYCLKDVLMQDTIWDNTSYTLGMGFEAEAMAANRAANHRGLPGDFELARKILPLWRRQRAEDVAEVARLTGWDDAQRVLNSPQAMLKWLRECGITLPNMQRATLKKFIDTYAPWLSEEDPEPETEDDSDGEATMEYAGGEERTEDHSGDQSE